jgi:hypothetical protein
LKGPLDVIVSGDGGRLATTRERPRRRGRFPIGRRLRGQQLGKLHSWTGAATHSADLTSRPIAYGDGHHPLKPRHLLRGAGEEST